MAYIDLTQTFTESMPVYPGDAPATLKRMAAVEHDGYENHTVQSGMHVGTHLDAPRHMIAGGKRITDLQPERFFGSGYLLDVRGREVIDADLLESVTLPTQAMLLLWTGYDSHFRLPDYYAAHPVCTEAFAEALVDLGVQLLGMDTPSPDREPFAVHKLLLGHEILIVENLTNLESLVFAEHFELMALPMKFEAEGAFVRVIAQID